jgi:hypothetical protein
MPRRLPKPEKRKLRIEIVWDASVPIERRAEYEESVRRAIRAAAHVDGPSVVRAHVSAHASGLHWVLEPL